MVQSTAIKTTADTRVESANATTIFGTATLLTMSGDTAATKLRSKLKFDVSSIPATAVVTSWTLSLWTNGVPTGSGTFDFYDDVANFDWTEAQASFNNKNQGTTTAWTGGANGGAVHGSDISSTVRVSLAVSVANTADQQISGTGISNTWLQDIIAGTGQNADKIAYLTGVRNGSSNATLTGWRSRETTVGGGPNGSETPLLTVFYTTTLTRTVGCTAAVSTAGVTRTVATTAAVQRTSTRTVATTASVYSTLTRTVAATASVSQAGVTLTVATSAAVSSIGLARTVTATAAVNVAVARTVALSAAVSQANVTRTVPTSAAVSLANITRTVATTASVYSTLTRTVTATAAVSSTLTRTVAASAALQRTLTRDVPTSAAVQGTVTRTVAATASTIFRLTRTVPITAAVAAVVTSVYLPGKDTYTDHHNLTTNFAIATEFSIYGMDAADPSYALIGIDLSAIPAGHVCTSANLALTVSSISGSDRTYDVYKFISNGSWTEAGATWNTRDGVTAWTGGANGGGVQGTDVTATAIGTATYLANTPVGSVITFNLDAASVAAEFGGNISLLIKKQGTSTSSTPRFATSDHLTVAYRPVFTVAYVAFVRSVPASAAVSLPALTRNVPATAAVSVSGSRTVPTSAAVSVEYFISPTGTDGLSGRTPAAAWRTFTYALPRLSAGDILTVADGDYVESPQLGAGSTTDGTAERRTLIRAASGARPWIRGATKVNNCSYWDWLGISFDGSTVPYVSSPASPDSCVYWRHASNWTMVGCEVRSKVGANTDAPGSTGGFKGLIDIDGDNWLIDNCYVHHNPGLRNHIPNDADGNGVHQDHCIYVSHGTGGTIRRTLLTDAPNGRAVKYGQPDTTGIDPSFLTLDRVTALRCNGPTTIMGSYGANNGVITLSLVGGPVGSDAGGTGLVTSSNATAALMITISNSHGWSNGSPSGKGTTWVSTGQTYMVEGAGNTFGTDPLLDATYQPHAGSLWTGASFGVGTITRGHLTGLSSSASWGGPQALTTNAIDVPITAAVSRAANTRIVPATASVSTLGLTRTVPATGATSATTTRTVSATASVSVANISRNIPATVSVATLGLARDVPATASVQTVITRTLATTAAVTSVALTRTVTTDAAVSETIIGATRTVPTDAAVSRAAVTRTVATDAAVAVLAQTRTVPSSASILAILTRTVATSASVSVTGTFIRDVDATAAVSTSANTRTVPTTAALSRITTRDVPASASVYRQRDVTASAAVSRAAVTRTVPTSAAVNAAVTLARTVATSASLSLAGVTRTLPATAAVATLGQIRTIPATVALRSTTTRDVSTSAAVSRTETRTLAIDAAVSSIVTRAVPASAAIGAPVPRVIDLLGRDDSTLDVGGRDDSLIDLQGDELMPVITAETFYIGSDYVVRMTVDGVGTIAGESYRAKLWDKKRRHGYVLSTDDGVSSIAVTDGDNRVVSWTIADSDWPVGLVPNANYEFAIWRDDDGSDIPFATGPATLVLLPGSET